MIIVIGNQKGGVGKSTLATNLAVAWQELEKNVAIIEADPSIFTTSNWSSDREEANLSPILTVKKTGRLKETLTSLNGQYDVVLVDLAGKDSEEMRSSLLIADLFLVPTQPAQPDVDATMDLIPIIDFATDYNPKLKTAIVFNRVATHAWNTERDEAAEVLSEYYETILPTVIHERRAYRSALVEGRSAIEGSDLKASGEIRSLVTDIEKVVEHGV